jgi:polyketide synthase 13
MTADALARPDEAEIRRFIRTALATALGLAPEAIDDDRGFDAYGLPSIEAVSLTADLEDWLGRPVDAEAALEHASVAQLARHLAAAP